MNLQVKRSRIRFPREKMVQTNSSPKATQLVCVLAVFLCALLLPFSAQTENTAPVIAVGSEIDFPPYAIVNAAGRASGFSVELLEAVAETMGLHIKVTTGPWPEVLASFKSRKYDLLPLVALSPQRADMATYTKPHTIAYDSFFVRRGSRPIASLAEAKGKDIVVMGSDAAHEKLDASGVRARIIETKTIPEAMLLLASGKHDAVLVPKLLGLIVLREAKLEEVIEAGNPIADYNRHFAFAVQRGNTELRDKLEQGLAIIRSTGRYDALYRRWFGGIEPQKRRLKTIIVNNYHPYTYMNEKGEPDGFSVEIAIAVAKTMDLDLEIRADKWDLSMKELETGGIDLIPMMAYSPERDEQFDFSVPYTIAYDTIFYKKGEKGIRSLNDLNGKTVIVTNNDAAHGYLLSSGLSKTMNISLANSLPDALKQLAAGKGDAAIMPKLVGLVVAKNLNLTEIDVSPEIIAGYNRAWCFAVRNGDQAMLDRLNQGLNIIKSTGEYDVIYKKWFGALEGTKLQWKTILIYGSAVVLILLGSIFWNVMLKRQVKSKTVHLEAEIAERNRAEEKIQASLREKETLLKEIHHRVKNNLQIISSLLSLQAKSIEDEKLEGIFRECQDRIAAMASVHQLLYKSQNFAEINFGDYLRETASQLFRSYKTGKSTISLVIQAENVMLPIDTAIPCGLIINELVTNALKYAFPGASKGEIKIEMSQTKQGIRLLFEDNGIGFPKDVDFSNSGTLGLKLIHLLVKQLDGSIEQFINGGTRYAIRLKPETPDEEV